MFESHRPDQLIEGSRPVFKTLNITHLSNRDTYRDTYIEVSFFKILILIKVFKPFRHEKSGGRGMDQKI